jgi:hypothetical protein
MHQQVLRIIPSSDHSGDDMCELLKNHIFSDVGDGKTMKGVNLDPQKVIAIVCDNASTNGVMIEKLKRWLERTAKPKETPHKIYAGYCFAHVLHRIATVMLVYVNSFLGDLRSAITSLNHSVQLQKYLDHSIKMYNSMVSEEKKIKFNKLSDDVATRWNSTYKMISQSIILIEQLDANTLQKIQIHNVSL